MTGKRTKTTTKEIKPIRKSKRKIPKKTPLVKRVPEVAKPIDFRTIGELAKFGLTNEQFASVLGIALKTFNAWMKESPKLKELVKEGKLQGDMEIEKSLRKKAMGYVVVETTNETIKKNGEVVWEKETKREKHIAPDNASIIFWLKNRETERWRDRQESVEKPSVEVVIRDYRGGRSK